MKKSLIYSLATAALLASCSDDLEFSQGKIDNEVNGKLVKTGLLSGSRSSEATRGYSQAGKFVWMPEVDGISGEVTNGYLQLGLCWTGVNNAAPEFGARPAANENVYTNYLFEHVGWLDVDAEMPEVEECSPKFIDNGAFIKGFTIDGYTLPYAHFTGGLSGSRENKYYEQDNAAGALGKYDDGDLNLGSGLFYTKNSTVFEGEYLVYFPYTDAFTKGQIVAWEPKAYDYDQAVDMYQNLDKYTFAIGQIAQYEGGQQGAMFRTANLAGFANIRLTNRYGWGATSYDIKEAILYSPKTGIIYEQKVDAAKAVAACKAGTLTKDILSAGTEEKSNTVFATLDNGGAGYATINDGATEKIILPVLPQVVDDLELILINKDGLSYRKKLGSTEFKPNKSANIDVTLDEPGVTFTPTHYVVNEETFNTAWDEVKTSGAAGSIVVLNDIVLETARIYDFAQNVTVKTECDNVNIEFAAANFGIKPGADDKAVTFDENVTLIVDGMGCCGSSVASLNIGKTSGYKNGQYIVKEQIINYGELDIDAGAKKTTYNIADIQNVYDEWAVKKGKTGGAAILNITNTNTNELETNVTIGNLNNVGDVSISTAAGTVRTLDVDITTLTNTGTYANGKTVANDPADRVSGSIAVGPNALVTVNTLNNTNEIAFIQVGSNSGYTTTEGRIDVAKSTNAGTIDNAGVMNFASSLDNNGIFVDRLYGQVGENPVDNGAVGSTTKYYGGIHITANKYATDLAQEGIYVAQVNTVERMAFVLADEVVSQSAQVIEITELANDITFNVDDYAQDLENYDVRVDEDTYDVTFNANDGTKNVEGYFANCLDIIEGDVILTKGLLKAKNVTAEEGTTLTANGAKCEVTIDNDLFVDKTAVADFNNKSLTVGNNTKIAGEFDSDANTVYTMKNVEVTEDGEFDSNGDGNNITGNFATAGETTFAAYTSTKIGGNFSATAGTFEREQVGGNPSSRATVNVAGTVSHTGSATTTSAWPTKIK